MSTLYLSYLTDLSKLSNVSYLTHLTNGTSHLLYSLSMWISKMMYIWLISLLWLYLRLVHRIQLVYLSNIHLISCYLTTRLSWLVCNSLCLCMCLSLCCLVRNSTNLTHYCINILWVLRGHDLCSNLLHSLSTDNTSKLSNPSSNTLGMMKMRYLYLMSIIEIARKSTVSNPIGISNLLCLRWSSPLYDILWMGVLLRNLLCIVLLICTWFIS